MKNEIEIINDDEQLLLNDVSLLIEQSRRAMYSQVKHGTILLFWRVGKRISEDVLKNQRAEYGKKTVPLLATHLTEKYGSSFALRNLRRMMQFAEQFTDFEIVSPSASQLSWSHFSEILRVEPMDAKLFYLQEAVQSLATRQQLRNMINRKAYERKEIANNKISIESSLIPLDTFKDPYLFDVLGLKDEYLEADLEEAILRELEKFILEFGKGFTFAERQKRMIIDGYDHHLDLLFYNRHLKRLVAVELKMGKFEAAHKGYGKLNVMKSIA